MQSMQSGRASLSSSVGAVVRFGVDGDADDSRKGLREEEEDDDDDDEDDREVDGGVGGEDVGDETDARGEDHGIDVDVEGVLDDAIELSDGPPHAVDEEQDLVQVEDELLREESRVKRKGARKAVDRATANRMVRAAFVRELLLNSVALDTALASCPSR
jgi:hypothetical protein